MRPRRIEPGPGQESVWDYPRPPRVEPALAPVVVELGGVVIARSARALRVLETSHPPVYYVPAVDVADSVLEAVEGTTFCEFKGTASYFDARAGGELRTRVAWTYRSPSPGYEQLARAVAFYPSRVDAAHVGDERVRSQEGDFYGGWITSEIVGPFKGGSGTMGW